MLVSKNVFLELVEDSSYDDAEVFLVSASAQIAALRAASKRTVPNN